MAFCWFSVQTLFAMEQSWTSTQDQRESSPPALLARRDGPVSHRENLIAKKKRICSTCKLPALDSINPYIVALGGDRKGRTYAETDAAREIADRLEGKAAQPIVGDDTASTSVTVNIEAARKKLFGDDE
jgi:hypothetical protein